MNATNSTNKSSENKTILNKKGSTERKKRWRKKNEEEKIKTVTKTTVLYFLMTYNRESWTANERQRGKTESKDSKYVEWTKNKKYRL